MLIPLQLLQFLLFQRLLLGNHGTGRFLSTGRLPESSSKLQKSTTTNSPSPHSHRLKVNKAPDFNSTTALATSKGFKAHFKSKSLSLRRLSPLQSRQGTTVLTPLSTILGSNSVVAALNSGLIALIIIEEVAVAITIAIAVAYIILILIKIFIILFKKFSTAIMTSIPIASTIGTNALLNSQFGRKIRDILLKYQRLLQKFGLKKDRLLIFKIFRSQPLDWEHFTENDWSRAQIRLARQKLYNLRSEVAIMNQYLDQMSDNYYKQLARRHQKLYCATKGKNSAKCEDNRQFWESNKAHLPHFDDPLADPQIPWSVYVQPKPEKRMDSVPASRVKPILLASRRRRTQKSPPSVSLASKAAGQSVYQHQGKPQILL